MSLIYVLIKDNGTKVQRIDRDEALLLYAESIEITREKYGYSDTQPPDEYAAEVLKDPESVGLVLAIGDDENGAPVSIGIVKI
jgi:hypothetical protein